MVASNDRSARKQAEVVVQELREDWKQVRALLTTVDSVEADIFKSALISPLLNNGKTCPSVAVYTHTHTYIRIYIHTYIHTCIYRKDLSLCSHIHTYIHTYIPTYIHVYTYTYVCMYVCMYACIHTHTHTFIYTQAASETRVRGCSSCTAGYHALSLELHATARQVAQLERVMAVVTQEAPILKSNF